MYVLAVLTAARSNDFTEKVADGDDAPEGSQGWLALLGVCEVLDEGHSLLQVEGLL